MFTEVDVRLMPLPLQYVHWTIVKFVHSSSEWLTEQFTTFFSDTTAESLNALQSAS